MIRRQLVCCATLVTASICTPAAYAQLSYTPPVLADPVDDYGRFAGWMETKMEIPVEGSLVKMTVRWNLVKETDICGSYVWLSGGAGTDSLRSDFLAVTHARDIQDHLAVRGIRTIEVVYDKRYASLGEPFVGWPKSSRALTSLWEFLVATHPGVEAPVAQGIRGVYGLSGGGLLTAHALAHHGLEDLVDVVVFDSSPFLTDLEETCTGTTVPYSLAAWNGATNVTCLGWGDKLDTDGFRALVDFFVFGAFPGGTLPSPCTDSAPGVFKGSGGTLTAAEWDAQSLLGGGSDVDYGELVMVSVMGTHDFLSPWIHEATRRYHDLTSAHKLGLDGIITIQGGCHGAWNPGGGSSNSHERLEEILECAVLRARCIQLFGSSPCQPSTCE